jgi:hypothetical protein
VLTSANAIAKFPDNYPHAGIIVGARILRPQPDLIVEYEWLNSHGPGYGDKGYLPLAPGKRVVAQSHPVAFMEIGMRFQTLKQGHDVWFNWDEIQSEGIVNLHGSHAAPALPVGARQIS